MTKHYNIKVSIEDVTIEDYLIIEADSEEEAKDLASIVFGKDLSEAPFDIDLDESKITIEVVPIKG